MMGTPPRPARLTFAALLVIMHALVLCGLALVIVVHMTVIGFEPLYDAPLVLIIPSCGMLALLAYGLLRGRRWSRLATVVIIPISALFYLLFLLVLGGLMLTDGGESISAAIDNLRLSAFLLCLLALPLAIVTPLLLIGSDISAYLRRTQLR